MLFQGAMYTKLQETPGVPRIGTEKELKKKRTSDEMNPECSIFGQTPREPDFV